MSRVIAVFSVPLHRRRLLRVRRWNALAVVDLMNGLPPFFALGKFHDPIVPARFGGTVVAMIAGAQLIDGALQMIDVGRGAQQVLESPSSHPRSIQRGCSIPPVCRLPVCRVPGPDRQAPTPLPAQPDSHHQYAAVECPFWPTVLQRLGIPTNVIIGTSFRGRATPRKRSPIPWNMT